MPNTIVIFGASGDLTSRKLIPALYQLFRKKRLPSDTRIVGLSRSPFSSEEWRSKLAETTKEFLGDDFDQSLWSSFAANVFYHPGNLEHDDDYASLSQDLEKIEGGVKTSRVYYLATAPQLYAEIV